MFHAHYEIKACFGGKKGSIVSDLSGVLIILATTVVAVMKTEVANTRNS